METSRGASLIINAPEFFLDPGFVAWLNNGEAKITMHQGGEPGEYSDVVVLVDPSLNGEGSDSDMPENIWNQIIDACRQNFKPRGGYHLIIWIRNI
ncbi:MAG: hypothetical protein PHE50_10655 [Dehalococcoidales bacterium]|nr:hypothetical protein [Dehalococcoidales bacterium]